MEQKLVYREGVFNILIKNKFKEMEFEDLDVWKLTDEIIDYLQVKAPKNEIQELGSEFIDELMEFAFKVKALTEMEKQSLNDRNVKLEKYLGEAAEMFCSKFGSSGKPLDKEELTRAAKSYCDQWYKDEQEHDEKLGSIYGFIMERILPKFSTAEVSGIRSMEEFQAKYFPNLVGKECPYCGIKTKAELEGK